MNLPNRKERRAHLKRAGALKSKAKMSLIEWAKTCQITNEQGKRYHELHLEENEKQIQDAYFDKEASEIKRLKELGHDQKYINSYLENWYNGTSGVGLKK